MDAQNYYKTLTCQKYIHIYGISCHNSVARWRVARFLIVVLSMMKKKKKTQSRLDDVIKAMRRGNREGQQEVLGPGFHSTNRVHRSKKTYTRKSKHKGFPE